MAINSQSSVNGNDADQRSPQPVNAAQQRHDHDLERQERAERDRRLDIAPARRHQRAGNRANVLEITNRITLARAVLMPQWTATTSSLPMMRSAKPSRERPIHQPTRKTIAASARSSQYIIRLGHGRSARRGRCSCPCTCCSPGHDLPHQLGEAEREDHEIDAGDRAASRGPRPPRTAAPASAADARPAPETAEIEAAATVYMPMPKNAAVDERDVVGRAGEQRPRRRQRRDTSRSRCRSTADSRRRPAAPAPPRPRSRRPITGCAARGARKRLPAARAGLRAARPTLTTSASRTGPPAAPTG